LNAYLHKCTNTLFTKPRYLRVIFTYRVHICIFPVCLSVNQMETLNFFFVKNIEGY
jgi:hypothetical protein